MPDYQRLDKFQLPENFRGRSAFVVQLWWLVQDTIFAWSPQFLYAWRRFLLRLFGASIGLDVLIRPTVRVTFPWKLSVGDYSWIGDHVELYTLGEINIGAHCVISQRSYLCTGSHDYSKPGFDIFARPIHIADRPTFNIIIVLKERDGIFRQASLYIAVKLFGVVFSPVSSNHINRHGPY